MIKNKKQMFIVIGVFTLVMLLGTVTYAFFNYTRTGQANNIRTGRIYFNSSQDGRLQLTNVFPVKSADVDESSLDSVTVVITGDTTYVDGEEFEITLVDVVNTVNNKSIPMNYIATYTANTGASIGESSDDYWNAREDKDASIYTLNANGEVEEGKQVLVGYIDNGATGINGTLTIKAYVDADRIAISDTYPQTEDVYQLNINMTGEELNDCVSYVTTDWQYKDDMDPGTTGLSFCQGTGTNYGETFQKALDNGTFISEDLTYFKEHNIIKLPDYYNGTTTEWVDRRTVLTTSEWNSLQSTPISFKIRTESKEGIWIESPTNGTIESCVGCKFIYTRNEMYTTWNTQSETPTVVTSGLSDSYLDIVEASGMNYFYGVILNANYEIERAYACGVKDNKPFCIEGEKDGLKYSEKQALLQGVDLFNNTCTVNQYETDCYADENYAITYDDGTVFVGGRPGEDGLYVDINGHLYPGSPE